MKRPATEGTKWRLDQILKRKAEQGVKVSKGLLIFVELVGICWYFFRIED